MSKILTNVADNSLMKEAQSETFRLLRKYLEPSFGPKGSNTGIMSSDESIKYTKDGHTILKSVIFQNPIETSIKNNIEELTRKIVLKVGDGTTSAVILSQIVYEEIDTYLSANGSRVNPYDFNRAFASVVSKINQKIRNRAKEFNAEVAYDISMVSTNGNEKVSNDIKDIYEKFGKEVYIDVGVSTNENTLLKEYDGMVVEVGYDEACYINTSDGKSSIRNPKIYMFRDPVDTVEQVTFLQLIIKRFFDSIQSGNIEPTVIMAPKITRDAQAVMTQVVDFMSQFDSTTRPPLLILANVQDEEKYDDIRELTGAKYIKKYIDPAIQAKEMEEGLAPTPENFHEFAGEADLVESGFNMTKFVNPKKMYNEDGSYSEIYKNLVSYLEGELKSIEDSTNDSKDKYVMKKRIQSLKASMVEYLVGGMTVVDRDNVRDLVEDAVLNCRSAAVNGYGNAANCEALIVTTDLHKELDDELEKSIAVILEISYCKLIRTLLVRNTSFDDSKIDEIVNQIKLKGLAYDVRKLELSDKIISSINSDIYILEAIGKIVTLIVTSNQFIVPDVHYNKYIDLSGEKGE